MGNDLIGQATRAGVFLALLATGTVAAPAWAQTFEGVPMGPDFKPADRAAELVQLRSDAAPLLKGLKRVAVSSFQVEFVYKGAASASSYRIGQSGTANTNMVMTLVGMTPADFQAITEAAYKDTVAGLQAQGLEVLPVDKVLAAAAYRKMAESGAPSPVETRSRDTWSVVHAPAGLAVYGEGATSSASMVPGLSVFSGMAAVMSSGLGMPDLSKELDAALLTYRLVVNFVDTQSSDKSWFSRSSGQAKVSWQVGPSVAPQRTVMQVARFHNSTMGGSDGNGPAGVARLELQAPLLIDGAAFKEVKDTSSVAANVGLAVLQLAIGKGGSSSAVEKEAVADPERYRELVGAGLGAAQAMFLQRLKTAQ